MIGGRAVPGENAPLEVVNPATEETLATAPSASEAQLDQAVEAAGEAYRSWSATPVEERRAVVRRVADAVEADSAEMAKLLTQEQGKPLAAAQGEIDRTVAWLRGFADMEWGDEVVLDDEQHTVTVQHPPLGVVGGIVPWNFPVTLAMWKIAPALVTGNTIVVKPSPFTPLTALRFGAVVKDIVPAGVVNVLSGDDSLGPAMTAHPGIAKIAFTGSSATGKKVMASAAETLKRVTLELGGKDAAVVLPDVDVESVAPQIFWAAFTNSGQYCLASKRIYVHRDIHDDFLAALVDYAKTVVIGDGLDEGTQLGPVQNSVQYEKVLDFIRESEEAGHDIVYRGEAAQSKGYFIAPVIVDDPPEDSRIAVEEPFGPIVPVFSFSDDEEVVRRVNSSEYGLGGSVWGTDVERATRVASSIESGVVWVNEIHKLSPFFPMGGHRQSGIGVENGHEGLLEYCSSRSVAVRK